MLFPPGVLTFAVFVALCGSVLAIIAPFAPTPALLALACREFPDSTPRVARGAADGGLPVLPAAMAKVLAAAAAAGWRSRRVAFSWSSMAYSHSSSGSPGLLAPEWKTGLGGIRGGGGGGDRASWRRGTPRQMDLELCPGRRGTRGLFGVAGDFERDLPFRASFLF